MADRFAGYVYSSDGSQAADDDGERIVLAVNVALATCRPLLLRGAPGCGKSSLARDVAHQLEWSYYEHIVISRTQAQDLLWKFDAVARLADAQAGHDTLPLGRYVVPGVLWWAFDPDSAARRGLSAAGAAELKLPPVPVPGVRRSEARAVILLDEIDKAEPDVPNDLLVPLGALRFLPPEAQSPIEVRPQQVPLVVITSNDERELPAAFLRRCIVLELKPPGRERLLSIARAHFPDVPGGTLDRVFLEFERFGELAKANGLRPPGTAEFLDAVRACFELGVEASSPVWSLVTQATLWKHPRSEGLQA